MLLENKLVEKENALQDELRQALSEQEKIFQQDLGAWKARSANAEQVHINDQASISSLRNTLVGKESTLKALCSQDELYQSNLDVCQSTVVELNRSNEKLNSELKQSNEALNCELSKGSVQDSVIEDHTERNEQISSIQMDLKNALNKCEEGEIQYNLQLATVNAGFHNAMNSLDELQKENQKLKEDIESFASIKNSKNYDENRNFEKEMNAAHARFVSMEKALEDRVSRLDREKGKLVVDFNAEMANQEEAHTKTKIELSAWKLEMQNALNDIESLKKEKDELTAQVESYAAALEAVCIGKAELEEKLFSLKSNS